MRRILLLTREFPPVVSPPAIRWGNFLVHLATHGWTATVLTTEPTPMDVCDPAGLVRRIPGEVRVERSVPAIGDHLLRNLLRLRLPGLARMIARDVMVPDPGVCSTPFWVRAGERLVIRDAPEVIIPTGPPFSLWGVAAHLGRRTGLPIVLDYRDPWTFPFISSDRLRATHRRQRRMELRVLRRAAAAVVTSDALEMELRRVWPGRADRVYRVTNGCDCASAAPPGLPPGRSPASPLVFLHAGSIYAERSVHSFLEGARLALRELPSGTRLRLRCVGRIFESPPPSGDSRLEIEFVSQRPQSDVPTEMAAADVLVLIQPPAFGPCIPGKVLEYLTSGRPILALVPPGSVVDRLLAECGGAVRVPVDDAAATARAIRELADPQRRLAVAKSLDTAKLAAYDRPRLAARLAAILDGIVGSPRGVPGP